MDIKNIVDTQRNYFNTGVTKNLKYRLEALQKLENSIENNKNLILEALKEDLNKSDIEAYMTEISLLKEDIRYIKKRLPKWSKNKRVRTSLMQFPAKCYVASEPFGVVLIMSPWNYPLLLALSPLVGAIAAGNCAVVKPSAYAPKTSLVINKVISEVFSDNYCCVVQGGRAENTELLKQKFDYIFFTGSIEVGKLVMESASKNLTPVSLELGGKSPVIIDQSADIDMAAKKLAFGKYINAGQTCIAPDYVFVHESKEKELLDSLKIYIEKFYPKNKDNEIEDYPKIVNKKHFERLLNLIEKDKVKIGGKYDEGKLSIEPTVMNEINFDSPIMQEEIFGPILPIMTFNNLEEVINKLHSLPKPLALYLFTCKREVKEKVIKEVSFGGGCINDVILHIATSHMGFGGVGNSGMGSYHGKHSFDTFTHYKSIVDKGLLIDISLRYRPYTENKKKLLKKL
ncbi:MAG: aldehyde dehydrogenase [Bacilli bacterium]|nr:aldehyde dehydrogenase [Bacilli bacterium]